jgi:hypothetical protein
MTTGRPRPILPEQPSGGNYEKNHRTGSRPPAKIRYLPGALKQLFREVKKVLTCKAPAPEPTKQRRRRTEETRGSFRLEAVNVMRRSLRLPAAAHAAAFMWDTLHWLHLWHWNDPASTQEAYDDDFHYAEQHHLSPHP